MEGTRIEKSLISYLTGQASENDIDELSHWIKDDENQKVFDEYVKLHFEISTALQNEEVTPLKNRLLSKIHICEKESIKKRRFHRKLKYAAALIILIIGTFFTTEFILNKNSDKSIPEKFVTLETDNGETIKIIPSNQKVITNANGNRIGNQKGENLFYDSEVHEAEPSYVTVNIPNGRKFKIVLADGTNVYLNSGSSLRYPTFFKSDAPRSVTLSGEAFFEVAKDKDHPFTVESDAMKINVIGTKFNVTNYPETKTIRTVLVEGSVSLFDSEMGSSIILKPNQKSEWDKEHKTLNIEDVDIYNYTAWMDGKLIFRKASFIAISHALERKYDVEIQIDNEALNKEIFDASFDVETIDEVLASFQHSYAFNYNIENDKIIIN